MGEHLAANKVTFIDSPHWCARPHVQVHGWKHSFHGTGAASIIVSGWEGQSMIVCTGALERSLRGTVAASASVSGQEGRSARRHGPCRQALKAKATEATQPLQDSSQNVPVAFSCIQF